MPFASERLYDGYLRRRMGTIVTQVKVREIIPHLPCLTQSDRDEIDAKRETTGNYNAMQLLLDCLKRRENWPEEFIRALELCEHWVLAREIRAEYEALQGCRTPVAPAVNAHARSPDPSPSLSASAPLQPSEVEAPLPQPDPQSVAISNGQNLIPVSTEASVIAAPSQIPAAPSGQGFPGASSQVLAPSNTFLPPSLPTVSDTPSPGPAVSLPEPQMSPVRPPVQDSNPPAANATQQPVENSDPTVNQVSADVRQARPAQGSSAQRSSKLGGLAAGADGTDGPAMSSLAGGPVGEEGFLSKPGTLLSCIAPAHRPPENRPFLAPVDEAPYSGDSGRLQFSSSFQEGATVLSHNEPEEDQYDSIPQSLQDVRMNVGHVSEDASLLNCTGQALPTSNEQPSLSAMHDYSPAVSEAEQATAGPRSPGQQQSNAQRDQIAVFPYNLLDKYFIPVSAIAGLAAVVMLWMFKK